MKRASNVFKWLDKTGIKTNPCRRNSHFPSCGWAAISQRLDRQIPRKFVTRTADGARFLNGAHGVVALPAGHAPSARPQAQQGQETLVQRRGHFACLQDSQNCSVLCLLWKRPRCASGDSEDSAPAWASPGTTGGSSRSQSAGQPGLLAPPLPCPGHPPPYRLGMRPRLGVYPVRGPQRRDAEGELGAGEAEAVRLRMRETSSQKSRPRNASRFSEMV